LITATSILPYEKGATRWRRKTERVSHFFAF
jgi:hypothetical protein